MRRASQPRRVRSSFLLSRMGSYRLALGAALVTAMVTATLAAALASFADGALPQAIHRQLATAHGTSIVVSGAVNAPIARQDDHVVRRSMRTALGSGALTISSARWSDPLGLPAPAHHKITPLAEAAAPDGIRARVVLTAGSWPGPPARGGPGRTGGGRQGQPGGQGQPGRHGQPGRPGGIPAAVPAAMPVAVASQLHLAPGDMLTVRDRDTGARVRLRITGIFRARQPASAYWQLTPAGPGGSTTSGTFVTYGPLIVAPAAFSHRNLAVGGASWLVLPHAGQFSAGNLTALAGRIDQADHVLQSAQLGGLQVSTGLPGLLRGVARNDVVARSLLVIGGLQLLLLAVAALALAASLLASQRAGETALLSARGGARWQLARLGGAESVLLAVTTVAAGSLAGGWLAGRLARSGPLHAAGLRLPAAPAAVWWAAGLVGLLCAVLLLWPAFRATTPGAARTRLGRPARAAGIARAGADVALVAIALVAIWQLRRYQAVVPSAQGSLTIDPVLIAAPVLALAAGTAVLLRLLPLTARIGDRLAARGRRLGAAMASWEISRRPVRQGASVLLVVLAAATSTLALAQHESWRRSIADQAAFSVGADVRVDTPVAARLSQVAAITRAPGVLDAMPVARPADSGSGEILALNARRAAATVLLRPDLSGMSPAALWRPLVTGAAGLAVPGRPARLAISVSLSRSAARFSPMQAALEVIDAAGVSYSLPAGFLPADGRMHRLVAVISPRREGAHPLPQAAYPLRLTGITLAYTLPEARTGLATLIVGGIATASGPTGPFAPSFSTGRALSRWITPMSAPGLALSINQAQSPGSPKAGPQDVVRSLAGRTGELLDFDPGYGAIENDTGRPSPLPGTLTLSAPPAAGPIPAVATRAYLTAADVTVGDTLTVTLGTASVRARIVAAVTRFPTVNGGGGALIVDLAALQSVLTSESAGSLPVTQWWLRTRQAAVPARLAATPARLAATPARVAAAPAGLPPGTTVTSSARTAAALLANPLSGLPEQALPAIALAAAALAAVGFSVSVAAGVRERRAQRALLAALGVSRAAQAGQLCLEQLMLSVPAAGAGLLLGAGLARLLIQAVTLTAAATAPVPAALIEIPWRMAAGLAVAVAVIPVLAAALTIARKPDPAAQLRAAESA